MAISPVLSQTYMPNLSLRGTVPTTVTSAPATAQDLITLSGAGPTRRTGTGQAIQLAGMGVMFSSIMVGASMSGPYGPAVMIGGMFAGLAIMAYGRDK